MFGKQDHRNRNSLLQADLLVSTDALQTFLKPGDQGFVDTEYRCKIQRHKRAAIAGAE